MSDTIYEYLDHVFEWDMAKARKNWMKHRILFTEAATVFFDPRVIFYEDSEHSVEEQRFIMVGYSARDRRLLVVHVYRAEKIRIISARTLTSWERKAYERELGR